MRMSRLFLGDVRPGTGDEGVAAVEFALVLPPLVVMLFTIVLGGSIYLDQLHLQSVVRDAARIASVDTSKACSTALSELSGNNVGTVSCLIVKACSSSNNIAEVKLTAVQTLSVPLVGSRVVSLHATSSFICTPT